MECTNDVSLLRPSAQLYPLDLHDGRFLPPLRKRSADRIQGIVEPFNARMQANRIICYQRVLNCYLRLSAEHRHSTVRRASQVCLLRQNHPTRLHCSNLSSWPFRCANLCPSFTSRNTHVPTAATAQILLGFTAFPLVTIGVTNAEVTSNSAVDDGAAD